MALAPGAENPSAAYLAGQQHGKALAVQHHTAAATTAPAKSKPAAPTKTAPVTQTSTPAAGSFDLAGLLKQAQALAQAQTAAQIKAIQAQQGVYTAQGQDRAKQINQASQAAAQFLAPLGDQTASSYTDAAKALGGLASGFSGQTGADATKAAQDVQANLANLGAPSGSARTATGQTSSPEGLQNVLYGLGGFIPGNLLLTSGQAAAAAARGLPASVLGHGQLEASGTLAAAQKQADTLTPQILDAQGKTPELARSIYNQALNGVYKQAQLTATQTRLNQGQERIDQTAANANATAAYRQTMIGFRQQGLTIQQNKYLNSLQQQIAKGARPNAALSKLYGHVVDVNGDAVTGADGKPIPVKSTSGAKPLTAATLDKLKGDAAYIAQNALNGNAKLKLKPINFGQTLQEMRVGGGHGAIPLPIALSQMKQAGWTIPAKYNKILGTQATAGGSGDTGAGVGDSVGQLTQAGGFLPSGVPLTMGRADQGRDIQTAPGTPIVAPGAGVVVAVKSDPGAGGAHFGPSYPVVHFTSGPYAGQTIYIGHTVAALQPGQPFHAGDILSHTQRSGPSNGGAPDGWAEIGFAPGGAPGSFGQKPPF